MPHLTVVPGGLDSDTGDLIREKRREEWRDLLSSPGFQLVLIAVALLFLLPSPATKP